MIVKIGESVYDSSTQPILLVLSKKSRENIANMAESATMYCEYPDGIPLEDIREFMILPEKKDV